MEESKIHELFDVTIDFEKQTFRTRNLNPYEVAVAAARYARNLNDRVRKFYGPEMNIHPRNIAMKKLEDLKTQIVYKDDAQKTLPEKPKGTE